MKEKTVTLNSAGFKKIEQLIYETIPEKGIGAKELLRSLAEVAQENAWEVIEFLQSERKLKVDERGYDTPATLNQRPRVYNKPRGFNIYAAALAPDA